MIQMKTMIVASVSAILVLPVATFAEQPVTESEKFSYALGYQVGSQIRSQFSNENLKIDPDRFGQAIADVLADRDPAMDAGEMQASLEKERDKQQAEQTAKADASRERSAAYLEENAKMEGVVVTDSGIQYRVLEEGSGATPGAEDTVVVHYRGTLIDGTEFDSSYKRGQPATFALGGIIPGWQEALQLMKEGDRWEVIIPSELAYGERGAGGVIGPNETLVFEIELMEVK
jgi:FKBP-type peptidyl-prolyl cis-trans isomerase FklB